MFRNSIPCLAWLLVLLPLGLQATGRSAPRFALDLPALTPGEKYVLEQVTAGKTADLKSQFGDETNRVLRGAFVENLITQRGTNVHRNGFSIEHAVLLEAVDLSNAEVHYQVNLVKCRFAAEVNFSKSIFDNNISLEGSAFEREANFSAMKIGRAACFKEAVFAGPVSFLNAQIAENWSLEGCAFTNPKAFVNFEAVKVGGATTFEGARFAGYVSFKDAKFAELDLAKAVWPVERSDHPWLWLNGMTYQRISAGSEQDSWRNLYNLVVRTARRSAYSADIFTGLEDYYRRLGYAHQANMFFRAQKHREREEVLSGPAWAWSFFLDWFVGYGRSPERALFWSVLVVAIGCAVFRPGRMEPQKSEYTGRKYSPFWYSMDVYLPVIKLHDAEIWKPKEACVFAHVWRRIHTVLGWALIPIAIAAWTGMLSH